MNTINITDYFIRLLEGRDQERVSVWLTQNAEQLKNHFKRQQWLHLKFSPFDFAEEYLLEKKIPFSKDQASVNFGKFVFAHGDTFLQDTQETIYASFNALHDGFPALFFESKEQCTTKKSDVNSQFTHRLNQLIIEAQDEAEYLTQKTQELLFFAETSAYLFPEFAMAIVDGIESFFTKQQISFCEIAEARNRIRQLYRQKNRLKRSENQKGDDDRI